ncbi:DNase I-like protein [Marasmius fiardii PR-910]|nr:DNase I-like protein [Marasmius fiardii PR-910]
MSELQSALRILLRDTDEIITLIEAFNVSEHPTSAGEEGSPSSPGLETLGDLRNRRALAVVVHKEPGSNREEGSLFILKPKRLSNGYPDELEIRHVFPICGDFTISVAQMKRQESIDLRSSTRSHSSTRSISAARNQQDSGLKLIVNPGLSASETLSFFTYDVQGLQSVLAEYRRLKAASEDTLPVSPTQTFSWLATYTSRSISIPTLSTIPLDLRLELLPLHTRLSDASAGIAGDDSDDLLYIREEWVRTRAREGCRKGRVKLKVRIGTFNVNGKMPSQDLATWVNGRSVSSKYSDRGGSTLPPVKEVSPLSIGDLDKNPLDEANDRNRASSPTTTVESESSTLNEHPNPPTDAGSTPGIDASALDDPDVMVFGFQELDLSTEALIYSTSTTREDAWCMAIFAALGEKGELYEKLASKQLVGMLIVIVVKSSLRSCFSNIMTSSAGVGIMGIMGNKGGTAIRLTFTPPPSGTLHSENNSGTSSEDAHKNPIHHIVSETRKKVSESLRHVESHSEKSVVSGSTDDHDVMAPGPTTLTFVCSHLAAFDEMVDKRNSDYQDLTKRLLFLETLPSNAEAENIPHGPGVRAPTRSASTGSGVSFDGNANVVPARRSTQYSPNAATTPTLERYNVFETDVLFWMSDLNYRIDLPDSDVRAVLASEHWDNKFDALLKYDQLKHSIQNKKAFDVFSEHPITHLPTYRFSGGIVADGLGYDTKRKPAWTDRVLYAHSPLTSSIHQLSYSGHQEITLSDHKPVSADFGVDVDIYDENDLSGTARHLFRQLRGMEENQSRVKTELSHTTIEIGEISYRQLVKRTFTIHNTGKVASAFRFVPIDVGSELHPKWLNVSPVTGLLLPNEVAEIILSVFVDDRTASKLNLGPKNLDCTLIMHTLLGKDHFITISGQYQYTCFANKLSRLTRLPGPIRSLAGPQDLLHEDRAINAPREIMRLVNWMMTDGSHAVEDIFVLDADEHIEHQIRESLDTGNEFPFPTEQKDSATLIAFGETLFRLLSSLPEGIIPEALHSRCGQVTSRDEAFEILDALSPAAVNVWISVTAFLHFIVQSSSQPDLRAERIASRFAPILFRDGYEASLSISPLMTHRFLLHFIQ